MTHGSAATLEPPTAVSVRRPGWALWLGVAAVTALAALSVPAAVAELWKILAIAWTSFGAMVAGTLVGVRGPAGARGLVWGYGLTSGAMTASAAAFLVPLAVRLQPQFGGFGIAAGLLTGFAIGSLASRSGHHAGEMTDTTVVRITTHALTAGVIIGMVYAQLPSVGLLLGLSIISHKGPAGYAAARWLSRRGSSPAALLLPAVGVGVPALAVGLAQPQIPSFAKAVLFGFAAGIFLNIASDFLPRSGSPHLRGEDQAGEPGRIHAAASTVLGGLAVFVAWLAIQA